MFFHSYCPMPAWLPGYPSPPASLLNKRPRKNPQAGKSTMKETLLVFSPIIQAGHKEMLPISPRLGCYWGKMEGVFFLLEIFQPSTLIQCHQGWNLFPPDALCPSSKEALPGLDQNPSSSFLSWISLCSWWQGL